LVVELGEESRSRLFGSHIERDGDRLSSVHLFHPLIKVRGHIEGHRKAPSIHLLEAGVWSRGGVERHQSKVRFRGHIGRHHAEIWLRGHIFRLRTHIWGHVEDAHLRLRGHIGRLKTSILHISIRAHISRVRLRPHIWSHILRLRPHIWSHILRLRPHIWSHILRLRPHIALAAILIDRDLSLVVTLILIIAASYRDSDANPQDCWEGRSSALAQERAAALIKLLANFHEDAADFMLRHGASNPWQGIKNFRSIAEELRCLRRGSARSFRDGAVETRGHR